MTVDVVLDMIPAVVWALKDRWLLLEDDPPLAPGSISKAHMLHYTLDQWATLTKTLSESSVMKKLK